MGVYKSADDLYQYMGRTFTAAFEDADLGARLKETGAKITMHFKDPDSVIAVDFGTGTVQFGEGATLAPDVDLFMDADVAHHFWLGKVNVPLAMAKRQIKAKGSIAKVLKIAPMMEPMYGKYAGILREAGLEAMLDQ